VAAALVGAEGTVTGVDMTDGQLEARLPGPRFKV